MYRHILVAVDGSHTSDMALQEALKLARNQDALLRIVHVVDEVTFNYDADFVNLPEVWAGLEKQGLEVLRRAAGAAEQAGITAETKLIVVGQAGQRIADRIEQEASVWPAELIVLGTHGRRGLSHALLGSVAEQVMRIATKPVLLVRGK